MMLQQPMDHKYSGRVGDDDVYAFGDRALMALYSIGDAVICTDNNGVIEFMNGLAESLTGWSRSEATGSPLHHIFRILNPATHAEDIDITATLMKTARTFRLPANTILIQRSGAEIVVEDASALIRDKEGERFGVVIVFRDVSISQAVANKMAYQAQHDSLTGLPNRYVLIDRITQQMKVSKRLNTRFSLLYVDLDNFKAINDRRSHAAGDKVLIEVAKRLGICMRDTDTVSRAGGDEFVILLCGLGDITLISGVTKKILEALARPIAIDGQQEIVTASIGVSVFPEHGPDAESMINNADAAMYLVKKGGGNNCRITGMMSNQHTVRQG